MTARANAASAKPIERMISKSKTLAGVIANNSGCLLQPPRIELNSRDRTSISLEKRSATFCNHEVLTHGKWAGTYGTLGVASGSICGPAERTIPGRKSSTQNNLDKALRTGS